MRPSARTTFALTVFWAVYAIAAGWALYRGVPPVGRDLLLILVAYSVVVGAIAGALALGRRFARLRRLRNSRDTSGAVPPLVVRSEGSGLKEVVLREINRMR